jgi:hypothetical protein
MGEATGQPAVNGGGATRRRWLGLTAVHLAMVIAALVGIGWTSMFGNPASGGAGSAMWVWLALVPAYCAACIWEGWAFATAGGQRKRLVVTQLLHWAAFLITMYVLLTPQVRAVLNDNAVGLALLTLLAMGTFLAGVHAWSLPVCATGVVLALAVPAIAWVDANILLVLAAVLIVGVLAGVAMVVRGRRAAPG